MLKKLSLLVLVFVVGCSSSTLNTKIQKSNSYLVKIEQGSKQDKELAKKDKFLLENGQTEFVKKQKEIRRLLTEGSLSQLSAIESDIKEYEKSSLTKEQRNDIIDMKSRIKVLRKSYK